HVAVERDHVGAEDLVADRLVEEAVLRQAHGTLLQRDAFRLQQQGLAEALGRDDDELVAALRTQERIDAGRQVQLAGGQVVRALNAFGIHRPGPHAPSASDSFPDDFHPVPPRSHIDSRRGAGVAVEWPRAATTRNGAPRWSRPTSPSADSATRFA